MKIVRGRWTFSTLLAVALLGSGGAARTAVTSPGTVSGCSPPRVHYSPYPGGGIGLGKIPWIQGTPRGVGLVGLLWYWPSEWRKARVRTARIFTHGVAPAGYSTKILWAFVARSVANSGGPEVVIRGSRLRGKGSFRQTFAAIGYAGQRGAPSFASGIDVPTPGCWKLQLSTGRLRASVVMLAVEGTS